MNILAVDRHLQGVCVLQRARDRDRGIRRELRRQRAVAHQGREVLAVDVLHGDEEIAVSIARIVDLGDARVDGGEVRLQFGAAPLGGNGIHRIGIVRMLDQFERYREAVRRVLRQVDIGHTAAPQLTEDLVLADPAAREGDHFASPAGLECAAVRGVRAGFGGSRRKFSSFTLSAPPGSSTTLRCTTLPSNAGRAPSRAATPAPLLS